MVRPDGLGSVFQLGGAEASIVEKKSFGFSATKDTHKERIWLILTNSFKGRQILYPCSHLDDTPDVIAMDRLMDFFH